MRNKFVEKTKPNINLEDNFNKLIFPQKLFFQFYEL